MNDFEAVDTAVFWKDYAALDELLKTADVDARDRDGRTALMYAIVAEDAEPRMIEYLVQHGADVNAVEKGGWTPLHFAARDHKVEIATILLSHGATIDSVDAYGNTPLSRCLSSAYPDKLAMVDFLLAHGTDPRRKNYYDSSPVDYARLVGKLDLVERLEQGARK
jgi:ankyrin repeat protein